MQDSQPEKVKEKDDSTGELIVHVVRDGTITDETIEKLKRIKVDDFKLVFVEVPSYEELVALQDELVIAGSPKMEDDFFSKIAGKFKVATFNKMSRSERIPHLKRGGFGNKRGKH